MKKIITSSLFLFLASVGFSQNAPINFETGGQGASWTWTTFENDSNPALQVVDNPSIAAPNTSSKVAKFTAIPGGKPWAGCESQKSTDIGTFTLTASNAVVKMMVYKSVISDVGIKFVKNDNSAIPEIKVANTKINEWEELTFNFSSKIGTPEATDITQIVVFMDFYSGTADRTTTTISYFDNITFTGGSALPVPTIPAMAPTKPATDVISMFSHVYTNRPVDTWRTSWSAATLTDFPIGTDTVKRYTALDFVGIETVANQINVTSMDMFEFDVWTPNSTTLKFKLVDFGADGAFGGGDDKEHETIINTPTLNTWNHIAIPLSDMTGLTSKSNIAQLIFASVPSGTSVIYVDNILFSKAPVLGEPTAAAPAPTKSAANVISMFSGAYSNVAVDTWRTSWSNATLTDIMIGSDSVKKYSALDFVGIETVANQINVSTMDSFEFDVWTPNSTTLKFKLVDFGADGAFGGGDDKEHETVITPTLNGWNHVSTSLASMTGLTSKSNIAQLIFASVPTGTSIIYVDNIFFSKNDATGLSSVTKEAVGVFPNPATESLNVVLPNGLSTDNTTIRIINQLGQEVMTANLNQIENQLSIQGLKAGLYTYIISNQDQTIQSSRLLVQ
ncbi:MAG: T9SS type A sorting domain-containing protein [Bacteroidia bacterium]|nr:T9SS type A sorting domain-containing protein [Bacteroidia bacterium]